MIKIIIVLSDLWTGNRFEKLIKEKFLTFNSFNLVVYKYQFESLRPDIVIKFERTLAVIILEPDSHEEDARDCMYRLLKLPTMSKKLQGKRKSEEGSRRYLWTDGSDGWNAKPIIRI